MRTKFFLSEFCERERERETMTDESEIVGLSKVIKKEIQFNLKATFPLIWAVVVAQLTEWLIPVAEVCGSNPVIGEFYENIYLL